MPAQTSSFKPVSKPLTVTVSRGLQLTGLGRTKFYQLLNERRIRSVTVGRRRLVVYASIEELLDSRAN